MKKVSKNLRKSLKKADFPKNRGFDFQILKNEDIFRFPPKVELSFDPKRQDFELFQDAFLNVKIFTLLLFSAQ